jgi:hypothetical protein
MMGARSVLLNLPVMMMMMKDEQDDACLCLTFSRLDVQHQERRSVT